MNPVGGNPQDDFASLSEIRLAQFEATLVRFRDWIDPLSDAIREWSADLRNRYTYPGDAEFEDIEAEAIEELREEILIDGYGEPLEYHPTAPVNRRLANPTAPVDGRPAMQPLLTTEEDVYNTVALLRDLSRVKRIVYPSPFLVKVHEVAKAALSWLQTEHGADLPSWEEYDQFVAEIGEDHIPYLPTRENDEARKFLSANESRRCLKTLGEIDGELDRYPELTDNFTAVLRGWAQVSRENYEVRLDLPIAEIEKRFTDRLYALLKDDITLEPLSVPILGSNGLLYDARAVMIKLDGLPFEERDHVIFCDHPLALFAIDLLKSRYKYSFGSTLLDYLYTRLLNLRAPEDRPIIPRADNAEERRVQRERMAAQAEELRQAQARAKARDEKLAEDFRNMKADVEGLGPELRAMMEEHLYGPQREAFATADEEIRKRMHGIAEQDSKTEQEIRAEILQQMGKIAELRTEAAEIAERLAAAIAAGDQVKRATEEVKLALNKLETDIAIAQQDRLNMKLGLLMIGLCCFGGALALLKVTESAVALALVKATAGASIVQAAKVGEEINAQQKQKSSAL